MVRPWLGLERELQDLEQKDPKVREARKRLDETPLHIERHRRAMEARRKVGKRKMPEGEE